MSIQAGDLVMVVRETPCCGRTDASGRIFVAKQVAPVKRKCTYCMQVKDSLAARQPNGHWIELSRLKRIDPLREPESIDTHDEIPA